MKTPAKRFERVSLAEAHRHADDASRRQPARRVDLPDLQQQVQGQPEHEHRHQVGEQRHRAHVDHREAIGQVACVVQEDRGDPQALDRPHDQAHGHEDPTEGLTEARRPGLLPQDHGGQVAAEQDHGQNHRPAQGAQDALVHIGLGAHEQGRKPLQHDVVQAQAHQEGDTQDTGRHLRTFAEPRRDPLAELSNQLRFGRRRLLGALLEQHAEESSASGSARETVGESG